MIILSGPSCVGKSLTVSTLTKDHCYTTLIPLTSRAVRAGEKDGSDYHFKTLEQMKKLENQSGSGFWHIPVKTNIYGYLYKDISKIQIYDRVVIQAAAKIAEAIKGDFAESKLVFIDYLTEYEKDRRLKERFGSGKDFSDRLSHAEKERERIKAFDFVIRSDDPTVFSKKIVEINYGRNL